MKTHTNTHTVIHEHCQGIDIQVEKGEKAAMYISWPHDTEFWNCKNKP